MSERDEDFPVPRFARLDDRDGLKIFDPAEKARFELWTDGPLDPEEAEPDPFAFPLDSATIIEARRIEIPRLADVMLRDPEGNYLGRYSTAREEAHFEPGRYNVELTTTPMKLYLLVEAPVTISRTDRTSVIVDFGAPTEVRVGARSFAERPSGTVTISDDERDLMEAVELFSSALKTTSPERTFPTMRGHPPRIERGDVFRISRGLEKPETDVTLVVPPKRRAIVAMAPLAFYLGADLVEGDRPELVAKGVHREFPRLSGDRSWDRGMDDFERAVNRTLQQAFFFDCLVRTEGFYQIPLHERESFEADLGSKYNLDFAYLYDQSIPTQLDAYLSVPFDEIQSYLPRWNLLVDFVAAPEYVPLLPYAVNDLPLIRTNPPPEHRVLRPKGDLIEQHLTGQSLQSYREMQDPPSADDPDLHDMSFEGKAFTPRPAWTVEHAYVGDGYSRKANTFDLRGFENQLRAPRTDQEAITVNVVVNEATLKSEHIALHVWNDRNLLDFEVHRHEWPTRDELVEILETPCDFLHYVGRATSEGLYAQHDLLAFPDVHDLGAKAFFVQGCENPGDVSWLFARGAYGGIASTTEVRDMRHGDDLLVMGRWVARLLNQGFTLRSAMVVTDEAFPDRMEWTIVGDGGISLIDTVGLQPTLMNIRSDKQDVYSTSIKTYPSSSKSIGAISALATHDSGLHCIVPSTGPVVELNSLELRELLELEKLPVNLDGEYLWNDSYNLNRIF